ncbi:hypothetical protein C8Q77DRAFT_1091643 [Trametes polyzona]|nr:hypothetical protein C8Q77DRAFT_1091643 [Trametes polyzona]
MPLPPALWPSTAQPPSPIDRESVAMKQNIPEYGSTYDKSSFPLIGTRRRTISIPNLCILGLFLALFFAQNTGLVRCPINDVPASEKALLRREWAREKEAHRLDLGQWARERKEHVAELRVWGREREIQLADQEQLRRAFEREREGWQAERDEEERNRQVARDAFEGEVEGWRKQREDEERHRLEVVRRSQGVYWTEPHGESNCHTFGTRAYHAYLKDIPADVNWLEVCDNMPPVVIHGREMSKPFKCERNGNDDVVGVWYVDFDEPNCKPYWSSIEDKGCSPGQTGFQRFEARLNGIGSKDDWEMMCATTPADIRRMHFDGPTSCENRGVWSGMVGIWEFPNGSCR